MENNAEKTNDFRSIINKNNDGEEPVIIAQRFLNIFRQLHIFSADKKNEFNEMILQLSDEIRGMFSSLPGGSLLQEYVDDLENKYGKSRGANQGTATSSPEVVNETKPHIIANAIAENMQSEATPSKPYATPQIDSNFAKEIAQAFAEVMKSERQSPSKEWFKQALIITEEGRKRDNLELTKVISESQANLAKTLLQNNTMNASSASNNNANNIQINTTPFPPIEDLVGGIVKAQSELFANMTKTHTKELSEAISHVLKESQLMSTKSIIDTISAFQRENLRFLQSQNRGVRFRVEESDDFDDEDEEDDVIEDVLPSQRKKKKKKKKNRNKQDENLELKTETNDENGLDQSLFALDDISPKGEKTPSGSAIKESFIEKLINRGKNKDKKEFTREENEEQEEESFDKNIDDAIDNFFSESKWKFSEEFEKNDNKEQVIKEKTQGAAIAETIASDEHLDDILDLDGNFDIDDINFEESEIEPAETSFETSLPQSLPEDIFSEETIQSLTQEDEKVESKSAPQNEEEKTASVEEKWEWQEVSDDAPAPHLQNIDDDAEDDVEEVKEFSHIVPPAVINDIDETSVFENNVVLETTEATPILLDNEDTFIDLDAINDDTSNDWGFIEENAPTNDEQIISSSTGAEDDGWEWEEIIEEPVEASHNIVAEENIATNTPEQSATEDWEWEYEEEPSEAILTASEPPVNAPVNTTEEQKASSEEDWEWEYEEEPVSNTEKLSADNEGWEWEYEEVEEKPAGILKAETPEDGDWEWEYEETEEPSVISTEQSAEGEDWEWEYEEVEEEPQSKPSVVNP